MTAIESSRRRKKTVLIVDDHPMMRQGLSQLIDSESDLGVCGEAETAQDALNSAVRLRPDLMLLDISLPDKSGLELIKDLNALQPQLLILVVSMHDESLYAERVLRAGARGYIMKQEGGKCLMQAIRQVLSGKIYVSEKIASKILEIFSGHKADLESSPISRLTDREFEVFQFIGRGKSTKEIAQQLHLSVKTVEVHRANIKQKLAIRHAPELVHFAVRWMEGEQSGQSGKGHK